MQCWAAESFRVNKETPILPYPSSLNVNSRFSLSFSFLPLRRFLPPCIPNVSQSSNIRLQERNEVSGGVVGLPSGLFRRTFPLFLGILIYFQVSSSGVVVSVFVPMIFPR